MKQLFLCSYFAGVKDLFAQYVADKQLSKKVLFIPTAGNVEDYTGYIDEGREVFEKLGFDVEILDLASCDKETAQAKIFQTKLLYVSGGNPFYLLQELQKKHLLSLIREQIADGMIYIGESAGAEIASQDIAYTELMDDRTATPNLENTSGLNLVDFSPLPHYGEEPFANSVQGTLDTYKNKLQLLPIHNQQAIVVDGSEWQIQSNN